MQLIKALRAHACTRMAFVGTDDPATVLFQLARQFSQPVIVVCTSKFEAVQINLADHHHIVESKDDLDLVFEKELRGVEFFSGARGDEQYFTGLRADVLQSLFQYTNECSMPVLIYAKEVQIKNWNFHEEAESNIFDTLVEIKRLDQLNEIPGFNKRNPQIRHVVIITGCDTVELQAAANRVSGQLLRTYDAVLITSSGSYPNCEISVLAVKERIGGVILAAGGSNRYKQPKALLEWRGMTFIQNVIETAIKAGLDPVVVLLGAEAQRIEAVLGGLKIKIVMNEDWQKGQSESIKAGINALPPHLGAVVFLLVDQPHVPVELITSEIEIHAQSLAKVIVPMIADKRANPVLFDQVAFNELFLLKGDIGGRAVFSQLGVTYLPWHDSSILLDVDTPDDYERLKEMDKDE